MQTGKSENGDPASREAGTLLSPICDRSKKREKRDAHGSEGIGRLSLPCKEQVSKNARLLSFSLNAF